MNAFKINIHKFLKLYLSMSIGIFNPCGVDLSTMKHPLFYEDRMKLHTCTYSTHVGDLWKSAISRDRGPGNHAPEILAISRNASLYRGRPRYIADGRDVSRPSAVSEELASISARTAAIRPSLIVVGRDQSRKTTLYRSFFCDHQESILVTIFPETRNVVINCKCRIFKYPIRMV